jgi:hypothetical protein
VPQVVLFLRADGAVGEHHPHVLADQRPDGVIRVDPRVDALRRLELRPRGTELDGDNGGVLMKCSEKRRQVIQRFPTPDSPPSRPEGPLWRTFYFF